MLDRFWPAPVAGLIRAHQNRVSREMRDTAGETAAAAAAATALRTAPAATAGPAGYPPTEQPGTVLPGTVPPGAVQPGMTQQTVAPAAAIQPDIPGRRCRAGRDGGGHGRGEPARAGRHWLQRLVRRSPRT